jgi:hypothetical protein
MSPLVVKAADVWLPPSPIRRETKRENPATPQVPAL